MAYLSFNEAYNSNLTFSAEDTDEYKDAMQNDLPLKYTWAIWEQIMQSSDGKQAAQYSDAMHKFASFATVQEFWKLWNYMPQPSKLLEQKRMVREKPEGMQVIDSIMIFRDNIRPEWEDGMNATGGHFQFQLKPNKGGAQIDEFWNNIVLGMIGATIKPAKLIAGVRLVDKLSGARASNAIRLEVWFTGGGDAAAVDKLRKGVEMCMANRLDGSDGQAPKCETRWHQSK
mmetsp:Transcript_71487/g.198426  ORF Transcript_71487/g.198426 Transcript_71487/m.198426 type:complete len:229 (-) Transcript_71487:225-911(-)